MKNLLFKEICQRTPYGLKCVCDGHKDCTISGAYRDYKGNYRVIVRDIDEIGDMGDFPIELVKLALRSEMTEKESEEFNKLIRSIRDRGLVEKLPIITDWLYKHQIDINGLIPKGLAYESTTEEEQ